MSGCRHTLAALRITFSKSLFTFFAFSHFSSLKDNSKLTGRIIGWISFFGNCDLPIVLLVLLPKSSLLLAILLAVLLLLLAVPALMLLLFLLLLPLLLLLSLLPLLTVDGGACAGTDFVSPDSSFSLFFRMSFFSFSVLSFPFRDFFLFLAL